MRLIRIALVGTILLASILAIGLPRTDGSMTHLHGTGWLISWSWIRYADEGAIQISVRGNVVVDRHWNRR